MEARWDRRECLIFDCYKTRSQTCCNYCDRRLTCARVCMNSPERCGMSVTHEENRYEHRERMEGNDE